MTLQEARALVRSRIFEGGVVCPCCNRIARADVRYLNHGMVRYLQVLAEMSPDGEYVHTSEVILRLAEEGLGTTGSNSTTLLPHYGLIEKGPPRRDRKGRLKKGYWRPTEAGRRFLAGKIRVPARLVTYYRRFVRFEGPNVSVHDAEKQTGFSPGEG